MIFILFFKMLPNTNSLFINSYWYLPYLLFWLKTNFTKNVITFEKMCFLLGSGSVLETNLDPDTYREKNMRYVDQRVQYLGCKPLLSYLFRILLTSQVVRKWSGLLKTLLVWRFCPRSTPYFTIRISWKQRYPSLDKCSRKQKFPLPLLVFLVSVTEGWGLERFWSTPLKDDSN